ncbi:MAG: hypothetical protein NVSMB9_16520 [Isosphaeraceae bacterium]
MRAKLPGILVVGTDTGVGKTYIGSLMVREMSAVGLRVGVLKPVETGVPSTGNSWRPGDASSLLEARGGGVPIERVALLTFEEPLAPCVAARRGGQLLVQERIECAVQEALEWWAERADVMVVEGVGGLLCPLAEGTTVADLALRLDYPLLIVARRGLGTLNHVLLTVEAARLRSLRVAGVVLNRLEADEGSVAEKTNAEELARRLPGVAIVDEIGHPAKSTLSDPACSVDWFQWARPPRLRARE